MEPDEARAIEHLRRLLCSTEQQDNLIFLDNSALENQRLIAQQLIRYPSLLEWEKICSLYQLTQNKDSCSPALEKVAPFDSMIRERTAGVEKDCNWKVGIHLVQEGRSAVCILAGGMGTRLGSNMPKGMLPLSGLLSHDSVFAFIMKKIRRVKHLADASTTPLPVLIMTSDATHDLTKHFFEVHNFFDLNPDHIHFVEQSMLPCFTIKNGTPQYVFDTSSIAMSPCGNGDLYATLARSGMLCKLKEEYNTEYLHILNVDNPLARVADPYLSGYMKANNLDFAAKYVGREDPSESVGVFVVSRRRDCEKGVSAAPDEYSIWKCHVAEYTELDKASQQKRKPNGEFYYLCANIGMYCVSMKLVLSLCGDSLGRPSVNLPMHLATKRHPTQRSETGFVNIVKLESYVFDIISYAKHVGLLNVERCEEFSPVKCADSTNTIECNTPRRAAEDIMSLHESWLRAVGAIIIPNNDGIYRVEISPLISYDGEGLEKYKGRQISSPCYLN